MLSIRDSIGASCRCAVCRLLSLHCVICAKLLRISFTECRKQNILPSEIHFSCFSRTVGLAKMWKYLATQTFFVCMCMCVKRAESNYQQGVEHRSGLI